MLSDLKSMQRFIRFYCLTGKTSEVLPKTQSAMGRLFLCIILQLPFALSGCVKNSISSTRADSLRHATAGLLGQWQAVGYYDTYFMAEKPEMKWIPFSDDSRFSYEFTSAGNLKIAGKSNYCPYKQYRLKDPVHLALYGGPCDTAHYTISTLNADSLCLAQRWYEDQYIYVFIREDTTRVN